MMLIVVHSRELRLPCLPCACSRTSALVSIMVHRRLLDHRCSVYLPGLLPAAVRPAAVLPAAQQQGRKARSA